VEPSLQGMLRIDQRSLYLATAVAAGAIGPQSVVIAPLIVSILISGVLLPGNVAGLVLSVELMAVAIASFVVAPRMATVSRRTMALSGALIAVVAYTGSAMVSDTAMLFVTRAIAGLGAGLVLASGNASVASARDPDRLYSFVILATGLAHLLLLSVGPIFSSFWSYSGIAFMQALFILLLLPVLWLLPHRADTITRDPELPEGRPEQQSISRPYAAAIVVAVILFFTHNGAVWSFSQEIGRRTGLSDQQIGLILGITGFICLLGAVSAAILSTRFGRRAPLMVGIITCLILAVSITLTRDPVVYTICQALYQAAIFFTVPYLFGLAAKLDRFGRVLAAAGGGLMFGSALGPAVAGALVTLGGYTLMAFFIFVSLLLVILLSVAVHRFVERMDPVLTPMEDTSG
jgi:predicted MFS family arabinose efflux permease